MTERLNHKLDTSKLKTIKDIKNVFDTMALVASMGEDNEQYELAKEYFTIPYKHPEIKGSFQLPRKSLEEISQEFEEKIDKHIESIKHKFAELKCHQEYYYNQRFNRIIEDFEYARKNGRFPEKHRLIYSDNLGTNNFTSSFIIKQGNNHEGYYTIGNGYLRFYMPTKPNAITRWFMNKCLSIRWVDEK